MANKIKFDEEYWKKRCQLLENIIDNTPCDSDILTEQIAAHEAYTNFIKENGDPMKLNIQEFLEQIVAYGKNTLKA